MKIAITGAGGFLGRHFVAALKDGHEVLALTRRALADADAAVNYACTDYSLEELRHLLRGCQAIIHLAAQRAYVGENTNLLENGLLDYRLFQAAEDCGVGHVVHMSTRAVYGKQPAPWSDTTPAAPETIYALAKLHSEETAAYFLRRGLCITTLRLAQVFGLGEFHTSAVTTFIRNAHEGRRITLTAAGLRREYIYVRDVVEAIKKVLARPLNGIYNVGSGEIVSLENMALIILNAFGRQGNILRAENMKNAAEYSLMDSKKFREDFSWAPSWTFTKAAADIAGMLEDKKIARKYGLSVNR